MRDAMMWGRGCVWRWLWTGECAWGSMQIAARAGEGGGAKREAGEGERESKQTILIYLQSKDTSRDLL